MKHMNIYIVGSMSQVDMMERIKQTLEQVVLLDGTPYFKVDYPHCPGGVTDKEVVKNLYAAIDNSDQVMVLAKPDGSFGKGTTYLMAYAEKIGKPTVVVDAKSQEDLYGG